MCFANVLVNYPVDINMYEIDIRTQMGGFSIECMLDFRE